MQKRYFSRRSPIAFVPVFAILPIVGGFLRGGPTIWDLGLAGLYLVVSSLLYLRSRRLVAGADGGKLRFYTGVGLAEESVIELSSITALERPRPWFLTIRYGEGKAVSLENDKRVLDELAKDVEIFTGVKAGKGNEAARG